MRNRELDCLNPRKIGRVHNMLPPGTGLGLLPQHVGHSVAYGIKRRNRRQAQGPASGFQLAPCVAVDERKQDEAGIGGNIRQDPLQMAFGAHHRPEMLDHMLSAVKLRQCRLGNIFQGLAG